MDKEEIEYQKSIKELEKAEKELAEAKAEYRETIKASRKLRIESFLDFFKHWFVELPKAFTSGFKEGAKDEENKK